MDGLTVFARLPGSRSWKGFSKFTKGVHCGEVFLAPEFSGNLCIDIAIIIIGTRLNSSTFSIQFSVNNILIDNLLRTAGYVIGVSILL